MITVTFQDDSPHPLYEQLYRQLRQSIENGLLKEGEKLPSKRKLAAHLQISQRTVENAYAQLIVEGYVEPQEKRGYFVRRLEQPVNATGAPPPQPTPTTPANTAKPSYRYDLKTNAVNTADFPFSVWSKLLRESLREERDSLLEPIQPQGDWQLRQEIVRYLRQFRSMEVTPEQVILGAGTEYLLGLICELLPRHTFILEDPNYHKPAQLLASRQRAFYTVPLDAQGLRVDYLRDEDSAVVFSTPSHHFPLGAVMSINRRNQLLQWAAAHPDRYLIEDDYDSEYRFFLKPIPALHSLDQNGNVIYMNTFARTLAPSLRIAYMVLPPQLLRRYRQRLLFYACTVSQFEQSTLRRFLAGGYYERHLNRMRTIYRSRRDALLQGLAPLGGDWQISGQQAGLHLLLQAPQDGPTEAQLLQQATARGLRVYGLSQYYLKQPPETRTVLLGYGGYQPQSLAQAAALLCEAWQEIPASKEHSRSI